MKTNQLANVQHDYIRYANVWEDADILLKGLQPTAGKKHLSIASAGDNALMMLTSDPSVVVAVDINATQLYVCELKRAAIRQLSREDYIQFIGFEKAADRLSVFEKIKPNLSEEARDFWQQNLATIENGVIHGGKFERYFRLFANRVLPFIHTKKTVEKLLSPKTAEEQANFYENHWNTWRWRLLFKIFFSKYVMGKVGRDPAFLKQVEVSVGDFIFQKAETQLRSLTAQNNFILRYNLTGDFGQTLPDYVLSKNYEKVKSNIDRLELHLGLAESAFEKYGKFDYFNLSNIFEYMDAPTFRAVTEGLILGANDGARFGYWNLMVPRDMATLLPDRLKNNNTNKNVGEVQNLADVGRLRQLDRGFFYKEFIVNTLTTAP